MALYRTNVARSIPIVSEEALFGLLLTAAMAVYKRQNINCNTNIPSIKFSIIKVSSSPLLYLLASAIEKTKVTILSIIMFTNAADNFAVQPYFWKLVLQRGIQRFYPVLPWKSYRLPALQHESSR